MTHLLLVTTLDVEGRRNNREHHAIATFSQRFGRVTVVFRRRGRSGVGGLLRSTIDVTIRDGVTFVGVDPPLNPPEGTVRHLSREGARPGRMRRWLGTALDSVAIGRDALTIQALADAARPHLRRGERALCEAYGPWATAAAVRLRRERLLDAVAFVDRDYEPGFMTSALRRRWAAGAERRAAAQADLTFSISQRLAERLRDVPGARIELSPTGVDVGRFTSTLRTVPSARMIFVGLVAPWSGIEEALEAVALLRHDRPDAHLTVLGPSEPTYASVLRERVAALSLTHRVEWRGDRPRDEVAAALSEAAVGLATFRPHPLRIHAAPLKLLEYLACGLPVIALEGSAAGDLVLATRTGVTCSTTGQGIADATRGLLANADAYRRMSAAGPEAAAAHDWHLVLAREFEMLAALGKAAQSGSTVQGKAR